MIFKLTLFFCLSLFLAHNTIIYGQNDSISDISYYLDDGGMSERKNLFKINLLSVVNGDISVFYERALNKKISMDFGVGILFPFYVYELSGDAFVKEFHDDNLFGYSIWLFPKYYTQHSAPEYSYIGIQFRRRNYNNSYIYNDLTLKYGWQFIFFDHFTISGDIGIGYRFVEKSNDNSESDYGEAIIPFAINLGYIF